MTTKRTVLTRRPRRFDAETLALFCKLDGMPAQRRAFSGGGRELARRLGLVNEWWTGNSVLDRSDAPHHSPEYAAFKDWHTCRTAREALLAAVRSRGGMSASV